MRPRRRYTKWSRRFPPGSPAEWIAGGHVTCNIQCLNGGCKRTVDFRLDRFPLDHPWSRVGWCLVCPLLRAERIWLRGARGSIDDPSPTSPLWHPGHAHALTEALASSEVSRIVARHVGAEAGDGE